MTYYPTKHAKKRFMERFKNESVNEFEASNLLKESFNRSLYLGDDPRKSYIKFHWDAKFNNVLVINDLNKTIITTWKFKKTFRLLPFLQKGDLPPLDKCQLQYLEET